MRKVLYVLLFIPVLIFSQPAPRPLLVPYVFGGISSDHFGVTLDNRVDTFEFGQEAARRNAFVGGIGFQVINIGTNGAGRLDLEAQFEFYGGEFRFDSVFADTVINPQDSSLDSISSLARKKYNGFGIVPRLNWGVTLHDVFQPYVGLGVSIHRITIGNQSGWSIGPDLAVGMRLNVIGFCNARFQVETAPLPPLELSTTTPIGQPIYFVEPGFVSVFVGVEFLLCIGCF